MKQLFNMSRLITEIRVPGSELVAEFVIALVPHIVANLEKKTSKFYQNCYRESN